MAKKIVRVIGKDGMQLAIYPIVIEDHDERSIIDEIKLRLVEDGLDDTQAGGFQIENAD